VFFHTGRSNTRAFVSATNAIQPLEFTTCMWLRTTDRSGGLFSYSAPIVGNEFAVFTVPNDLDSDQP
jgi:hypothetical protein